MNLFIAGISYKTAPVELRERLAVNPARLGCAGCLLKAGGGLTETVVLSTCNRIEVYGVSERPIRDAASLFDYLGAGSFDVRPLLYYHQGADAANHLLSVTSGLDSMVLGETEITGQVKQAYHQAQQARLTGRVLNRLFQKALQTAKAVRTRTSIGRGATSVGSVALELAEKIFGGDLSGRSVMIIGAGKMGEACVKHLAKRGVKSVLVSNRSYERAESLAAEFNGRAVRLENSLEAMVEADIVISSTGSPQLILFRADIEKVMSSRRDRPLALIDIAVPRDIEPAAQQVAGVYLYDIDDLQEIVQENVRHREQELSLCCSIIAEETAEVMARLAPGPERVIPAREPARENWMLYGAACGA
jgi:glutamyl-tRNA reductase